MGKLIGVVASILVGLALATGVTFAVSTTSAPDKGVNLDDPAVPNNSGDSKSGVISGDVISDNGVVYGTNP